MLDYFWLIPLLPAVGVMINGLIGIKYFPKKGINIFAIGAPLFSFLLSFFSYLELLSLKPEERLIRKVLFEWIPGGVTVLNNGKDSVFNITASFQFDPLSAIMSLVVTGVGLLIHIYSIGYMGEDRGYGRYFTYLNLFTFSMLILVLSSNLALMFVGWEGVGLCSYLLIGFWYEKDSASNAGKKAFIVTRIGDFGFLLGILLTYFTFGSLEFLQIEKEILSGEIGKGVSITISLLLFCGAVGKSAQIPLYVWLPDAMEGPTPVSALIHAATMVVAGVYMVSRMNSLFTFSEVSLLVVAVVGGVTALYSATMALVQNDIKRILAYSTISQIGYMFLGCGVASFSSGMFHLVTHSFFKSLLFLSAGSVIHSLSGEMNIERMGGMKRYLPLTFPSFLIGALSISGVPGLSGFFSKDEILLRVYQSGNLSLYILALITASLTSFYMFRLIFLVFYGEKRNDSHPHESPPIMTYPLLILSFLSFIGGYIGLPEVLGGRNWFEEFLSPVIKLKNEHHSLSHQGEFILMTLSSLAALTGILISWLFYIKKRNLPEILSQRFKRIYNLLYNKYFVDEIYGKTFVKGTLNMGTFLSEYDLKVIDGFINGTALFTRETSSSSVLFDNRVVDGLVNFVGKIISIGSIIFRKLQTGLIQNYALAIIFGILIFVTVTLFL
ncbi:MAG: NADH-quinone oxidoreductase subunit L [Acidobacteriota bacterium]